MPFPLFSYLHCSYLHKFRHMFHKALQRVHRRHIAIWYRSNYGNVNIITLFSFNLHHWKFQTYVYIKHIVKFPHTVNQVQIVHTKKTQVRWQSDKTRQHESLMYNSAKMAYGYTTHRLKDCVSLPQFCCLHHSFFFFFLYIYIIFVVGVSHAHMFHKT